MKFLVDAQLPKQLAHFLDQQKFDSRHTLDLPNKNQTGDKEIMSVADRENRIIITKDSDFLDNYILENSPKQLLIVSTGNISNPNLIKLFKSNIGTLESLFQRYEVIEIDESEILVHY